VWLGALARAAVLQQARDGRAAPPLGVLWLTPMRALAADTTRALALPLPELAPAWTLGQRTGDTPSAARARQDRRLPTALVTTPESLSLMLTRESLAATLAGAHTVVVDEWHEMVGNKRGVQVQLALARLRRWNPALVVWGLSATLGNLEDAMATLCGPGATLARGRVDKAIVIDTLLPADPGRFSWGGHLGAQMQQPVVDEIERTMNASGGTTLVFTNVRSQAEIWYQLLLAARPEWAGLIALHHGSLDREVREWVEAGLKDGSLKAVVATSSLDLGVDFLPVERVLQIGSPKGVARLLQRAGRSGHAPGRASRVTLVPTNTLELVEAAAARRAALAGRVESRMSPEQPLDVLVQHLVTVALGADVDARTGAVRSGFDADSLYDEVRATVAFRSLAREAFDWALAFVERGGESLGAYPQHHRVARGDDGRWRVPDRGIALRHRLQVGTIVSDAAMQVAWLSGGRIGTVEEGFIARLKAGDCFVFAGRVLEYVRTQDMTAYVRKATKQRGIVPAWGGTKMALSEAMTDMVQALLNDSAQGDFLEPEMVAAQPMLQAQARLSRLPRPDELLIERWRSAEGHHLFLYPFGGRNVHMGLAQLLAWRLARAQPNTFSLSINDFGLELLAVQPVDVAPLVDGSAFATRSLLPDVLASLNSGELAQRRFREIARVAGLVFSGYPGAPKSAKQVQASSSLFWEVFRKYDGGNQLLAQAEREVLAQELEIERLRATLKRMAARRVAIVELSAPSPFALPLMVERFREELSTEKLADRLHRILAEAGRVLDGTDEGAPPRRRKRQSV
jgi:ATP-dependent helicase Lhr and Lhr-like helicase